MDDGIAMVITYFALTTFVIVGLIVTLVFDGGAVFLIAGLFLLFLILGIIMLTGRGAGLIAGVNTMSDEERSEYDLPRLSRSFGFFMIVCSFLPLTIGFCRPLTVPMLIIVIAALVVTIWYANAKCKLA